MISPAAVVHGVPVAIPSRKESAILKIRSISSISRSSIETMSYFGRRAIQLWLASANYDRIDSIDFAEANIYALIKWRGDILADVICTYREFPLSSIDQRRQLNRIRASQITQRS